MKKLLTFFLALIASVGTMFAWDYERVQIGDLYYNLDASNQTAEVTNENYTYYADNYPGLTDANIPFSVTYNAVEYRVTSIGNSAFERCDSLISVTIPNSITSIGMHAFYGCTSLASVTIPNSVTSIESDAFKGCTALTSIEIPNSVTSIGSYVFSGCSNLTSVTMGNSVASIEEATFSNCSNLVSIEIPNSVTSIGKSAFNECSSLTSIKIPNNVTCIGDYAFAYCSSLASVTIPNSVTSIGRYAFNYCYGLSSVTIPNNVTDIGQFAFNKVANVVYSGSATGSPWGAKSVNGFIEGWLVYSDNTKTTLSACFVVATGGIAIPNSVTSIGSSAFEGCSSLTSVSIPNSVTSIGYMAFWDCSGLTSVMIPNSVTKIGDYAFRGCSSLTSIDVSTNNPNFGSINGVLCNKDLTKLIQCPGGKQGAYLIPKSITSIEFCAFESCSGLTSVTIPNSVTSIGSNAFADCSGLTSVIIPNSITSIETAVFRDCSGLTSITLPNSLISIGYHAFQDCTGLTSITCEAMYPPGIGSMAFYNVNKSISVYVLAGSLDEYKNAYGWNEFENFLPITAEQTDVTTPTIEPDVVSAEIAWSAVSNAYTYELVIKDANNDTICTYTFNAQGQLTDIVFHKAPARYNEPQQTQSTGFVYTVTGLVPGTQYSYSIIAKSESGATLNTATSTFTTLNPEGIDDVMVNNKWKKGQKVLRNGHLFILRKGKIYTVTGMQVK